MVYIRRNTVLKTFLSLIVVLVDVKIQPSTFFTTLDFLPSPSTFYPHPRHWTLDIGPSTLDPRQKPKLFISVSTLGDKFVATIKCCNVRFTNNKILLPDTQVRRRSILLFVNRTLQHLIVPTHHIFIRIIYRPKCNSLQLQLPYF